MMLKTTIVLAAGLASGCAAAWPDPGPEVQCPDRVVCTSTSNCVPIGGTMEYFDPWHYDPKNAGTFEFFGVRNKELRQNFHRSECRYGLELKNHTTEFLYYVTSYQYNVETRHGPARWQDMGNREYSCSSTLSSDCHMQIFIYPNK